MILDGKELRDEILKDVKEEIEKCHIRATLAIISVGQNDASKIYIHNKKEACEKVGIKVIHYALEKTTQRNLQELIISLNKEDEITGIILQSPVPSNIDFDACASLIDTKKDIDGFTKENIYQLYMNKNSLIPCTVKGILKLLDAYKIPICGKNALIIGRGNIVGHPLSLALTNRDATVTLAHSKTKNLKELSQMADIIIACAGVPLLITADMVKKGAVVIDVGVSRKNGHILGDVDFENVKEKASFITPNPGGVGPMTVAMIIENIIEAYKKGSKENG